MARQNDQAQFVWVTEDHCVNLAQIRHVEFAQSGATVYWSAARERTQLTGEESRQLEMAIKNFHSLGERPEEFVREV